MLVLKTANLEDSAKEYAFMKDMPADENGMKNPWAGCSEEDTLSLSHEASAAEEKVSTETVCAPPLKSSNDSSRGGAM